MFNGIIDDFLVIVLDRSDLILAELPYIKACIDISACQKNEETDTKRDDVDDISLINGDRMHQSIVLFRIILSHVIDFYSPALKRSKIGVGIRIKVYCGI